MPNRAAGLRVVAIGAIVACAAVFVLAPSRAGAVPFVTQGHVCQSDPNHGCAYDSAGIGIVALDESCMSGACYTCANSPDEFCNGIGGWYGS